MDLKPIFFLVEALDGDYARLRREDRPAAEPRLVARALLPGDIREGMRLKFELFEYTIAE